MSDNNRMILAESTFVAAQEARNKLGIVAGMSPPLSWEDFCALQMPAREMEDWRFATISGMGLGGFSLAGGVDENVAAGIVAGVGDNDEFGGTIVVADGLVVAKTLSDEAKSAGIVVATMAEIPPELREKVRGLVVATNECEARDKIAGLHQAYALPAACLLYIPAGARIEKPFAIHNRSVADNGAAFPFLIVVAEENSAAKFAEFYFSDSGDSNALVVSRLAILAERGARISHELIQNLNAKTLFYRSEQTIVATNADVRATAINLGGKRARTITELRLSGNNANAELYSLSVATNAQEFDQRTIQRHAATNSASRLLFKNALFDKARTIFGGNIVVAENAQKSNAVQSNKNLILSPDATAHSLPGLEIDANDVHCSHGATNGAIDPSQLFYLQQRGLPMEAARALLVRGFAEEIVATIPSTTVADIARELVDLKLR